MHSVEIRATAARIIAKGKNSEFPKLTETRTGLRWIGNASRTVAALEAVERHADRECAA